MLNEAIGIAVNLYNAIKVGETGFSDSIIWSVIDNSAALDAYDVYLTFRRQSIVLMDELCYKYYDLDPVDLAELLRIVLNNIFFTFEGKIQNQNHGLAMGSNVSSIVAILFMHHV